MKHLSGNGNVSHQHSGHVDLRDSVVLVPVCRTFLQDVEVSFGCCETSAGNFRFFEAGVGPVSFAKLNFFDVQLADPVLENRRNRRASNFVNSEKFDVGNPGRRRRRVRQELVEHNVDLSNYTSGRQVSEQFKFLSPAS